MVRIPDTSCFVLSNLGEVLGGGLQTDYLQENGLIKVTGTIRIAGIISPPRGTLVQIAHVRPQDNTITRFPKTLRVARAVVSLGSGVTTVELADRLALSADSAKRGSRFVARRNPPDWWAALNAEDRRKAPPTIDAGKLVQHCMSKIGITIARGLDLLTYQKMAWAYDTSPGWVSVASDVIKSHRCRGWLNAQEQLVIRRLNVRKPGRTRLLSTDDLILIEPIAGGQDPFDVVQVNYRAVQRGRR